MKKYIMLLVLLAAGVTAQAQILVKVNGETVNFSEEKLRSIGVYRNQINFYTQNNRYSFDIKDLDALYFAETPSSVEELPAGQTAVVYDKQSDVVYVVNGEENATLELYTAGAVLAKSGKGNSLDLKGLAPGMYIVSYNNRINAKILRK
ncbi:MAG: hypothetical protein J6Q73_07930 [Bacteroidaceae bacterium]|nr:hypothetical protein [Bacteroidaceae bacterium]